MTTKKLTDYCLAKTGAALDYPFGPEPTVFKVEGKVFATIYQKNGITRYGMKCDPALSDTMRQQYASVTLMYKSPHWIYILQSGDITDDEIYYLIDHSYGLIIKALPKKIRERLLAVTE